MNNYGVYDSYFGDFIESFQSFAEAETYVLNQMKQGIKGFKIVLFLEDSSNLYETLKSY